MIKLSKYGEEIIALQKIKLAMYIFGVLVHLEYLNFQQRYNFLKIVTTYL